MEESAINTYLTFALPIATFLAVSQFIRYGLAGVILVATVVLARRYGQRSNPAL